MEGTEHQRHLSLKSSRLPLFFRFRKQHSTVANGLLGSVAGGILRRNAFNERLIARGVALISRPSCHSSSAESLLLRAGDAHLVDGQPLEPTANGVGQQRNHVRQGSGPCGAVASDRQNAVAQVDGVGVARVFDADHLIPMILHLRDFQMRRPGTLRCDHVEKYCRPSAGRVRVCRNSPTPAAHVPHVPYIGRHVG